MSNISAAVVIAVEGEHLQYWSLLLLNYYRIGSFRISQSLWFLAT
ncbi:hypothetical protein ACVSUJ_22895 [Yersinia enterocolitica]|nr:hypothetical protein [Yersinia enterocolitica]